MKHVPLIIVALVAAGAVALGACHTAVPRDEPIRHGAIRTAAELDALLAQKDRSPILIDLRDRKDFEAGHIPNFLNISNADGGELLATWITPFKRTKPVILICYGGNRSARAFEQLVLMGFREITDFTPGYAAYAKEKGEGYEAETGTCDCPVAK